MEAYHLPAAPNPPPMRGAYGCTYSESATLSTTKQSGEAPRRRNIFNKQEDGGISWFESSNTQCDSPHYSYAESGEHTKNYPYGEGEYDFCQEAWGYDSGVSIDSGEEALLIGTSQLNTPTGGSSSGGSHSPLLWELREGQGNAQKLVGEDEANTRKNAYFGGASQNLVECVEFSAEIEKRGRTDGEDEGGARRRRLSRQPHQNPPEHSKKDAFRAQKSTGITPLTQLKSIMSRGFSGSCLVTKKLLPVGDSAIAHKSSEDLGGRKERGVAAASFEFSSDFSPLSSSAVSSFSSPFSAFSPSSSPSSSPPSSSPPLSSSAVSSSLPPSSSSSSPPPSHTAGHHNECSIPFHKGELGGLLHLPAVLGNTTDPPFLGMKLENNGRGVLIRHQKTDGISSSTSSLCRLNPFEKICREKREERAVQTAAEAADSQVALGREEGGSSTTMASTRVWERVDPENLLSRYTQVTPRDGKHTSDYRRNEGDVSSGDVSVEAPHTLLTGGHHQKKQETRPSSEKEDVRESHWARGWWGVSQKKLESTKDGRGYCKESGLVESDGRSTEDISARINSKSITMNFSSGHSMGGLTGGSPLGHPTGGLRGSYPSVHSIEYSTNHPPAHSIEYSTNYPHPHPKTLTTNPTPPHSTTSSPLTHPPPQIPPNLTRNHTQKHRPLHPYPLTHTHLLEHPPSSKVDFPPMKSQPYTQPYQSDEETPSQQAAVTLSLNSSDSTRETRYPPKTSIFQAEKTSPPPPPTSRRSFSLCKSAEPRSRWEDMSSSGASSQHTEVTCREARSSASASYFNRAAFQTREFSEGILASRALQGGEKQLVSRGGWKHGEKLLISRGEGQKYNIKREIEALKVFSANIDECRASGVIYDRQKAKIFMKEKTRKMKEYLEFAHQTATHNAGGVRRDGKTISEGWKSAEGGGLMKRKDGEIANFKTMKQYNRDLNECVYRDVNERVYRDSNECVLVPNSGENSGETHTKAGCLEFDHQRREMRLGGGLNPGSAGGRGSLNDSRKEAWGSSQLSNDDLIAAHTAESLGGIYANSSESDRGGLGPAGWAALGMNTENLSASSQLTHRPQLPTHETKNSLQTAQHTRGEWLNPLPLQEEEQVAPSGCSAVKTLSQPEMQEVRKSYQEEEGKRSSNHAKSLYSPDLHESPSIEKGGFFPHTPALDASKKSLAEEIPCVSQHSRPSHNPHIATESQYDALRKIHTQQENRPPPSTYDYSASRVCAASEEKKNIRSRATATRRISAALPGSSSQRRYLSLTALMGGSNYNIGEDAGGTVHNNSNNRAGSYQERHFYVNSARPTSREAAIAQSREQRREKKMVGPAVSILQSFKPALSVVNEGNSEIQEEQEISGSGKANALKSMGMDGERFRSLQGDTQHIRWRDQQILRSSLEGNTQHSRWRDQQRLRSSLEGNTQHGQWRDQQRFLSSRPPPDNSLQSASTTAEAARNAGFRAEEAAKSSHQTTSDALDGVRETGALEGRNELQRYSRDREGRRRCEILEKEGGECETREGNARGGVNETPSKSLIPSRRFQERRSEAREEKLKSDFNFSTNVAENTQNHLKNHKKEDANVAVCQQRELSLRETSQCVSFPYLNGEKEGSFRRNLTGKQEEGGCRFGILRKQAHSPEDNQGLVELSSRKIIKEEIFPSERLENEKKTQCSARPTCTLAHTDTHSRTNSYTHTVMCGGSQKPGSDGIAAPWNTRSSIRSKKQQLEDLQEEEAKKRSIASIPPIYSLNDEFSQENRSNEMSSSRRTRSSSPTIKRASESSSEGVEEKGWKCKEKPVKRDHTTLRFFNNDGKIEEEPKKRPSNIHQDGGGLKNLNHLTLAWAPISVQQADEGGFLKPPSLKTRCVPRDDRGNVRHTRDLSFSGGAKELEEERTGRIKAQFELSMLVCLINRLLKTQGIDLTGPDSSKKMSSLQENTSEIIQDLTNPLVHASIQFSRLLRGLRKKFQGKKGSFPLKSENLEMKRGFVEVF